MQNPHLLMELILLKTLKGSNRWTQNLLCFVGFLGINRLRRKIFGLTYTRNYHANPTTTHTAAHRATWCVCFPILQGVGHPDQLVPSLDERKQNDPFRALDKDINSLKYTTMTAIIILFAIVLVLFVLTIYNNYDKNK